MSPWRYKASFLYLTLGTTRNSLPPLTLSLSPSLSLPHPLSPSPSTLNRLQVERMEQEELGRESPVTGGN